MSLRQRAGGAAAAPAPSTAAAPAARRQMSLIQKVLSDPDDVKWEKGELMAVLLVVKVVAGLGAGIACGLNSVMGGLGFAVFIIGCALSTVMTYHTMLKVDEEEFGGHVHLLMEDANVAVPAFLLSWVLTYTSLLQ